MTAAAIVAVLAILALDGADEHQVALPPLRATKLETAARDARCEFTRARRGQRLDPPVDGAPASRPAAPGVYDAPPDAPSLLASLRRGIIVVHVRADVPDAAFAALAEIQQAVPEGTIVTRAAPGTRFQVAVTAYRRLLGCPRLSAQTLDAVRLFRGRFVGTGPG
jgi:hypothetical protein